MLADATWLTEFVIVFNSLWIGCDWYVSRVPPQAEQAVPSAVRQVVRAHIHRQDAREDTVTIGDIIIRTHPDDVVQGRTAGQSARSKLGMKRMARMFRYCRLRLFVFERFAFTDVV